MTTEAEFFRVFVWVWLAIAASVFVSLFFISAPYGRHARAGWGPSVPFMAGWMLMEAPAPLGMLAWFWVGGRTDVVSFVLLGLWLLHYVQRTFIYAWIRRDRGKPMPLSVALMGFVFNIGNSYLLGRWLFHLAPPFDSSWLVDPRFLAGTALFLAGWAGNIQADSTLLALRQPGDTSYRIPHGGLYRWISCPNYATEIVEWFGFALLTWSVPALAFALWTAANLAPRAVAHHRWYREKFPDYPPNRRALVPGVL
jgi:hypothetical protein